MFQALLAEMTDGTLRVGLQSIAEESLPPGEVLIRVEYSSVNYKDALAVTGKGRVIRSFPMVPGIDLAGTVESSADARWKAGDAVIVTGWGIGETYWGGYAGKARVKADWPVARPAALDAKRSMVLGTAGLTAMMSVMALEEHGVAPGKGDVVVTGAGGGVGTIAVALLARLGYRVFAGTGRPELEPYFMKLGAAGVVSRAELTEAKRPLASERWAGAVDTVGGEILASVLRVVARHGSVTTCGLAQSADLPTTVLPFILRGVNLLGIDSVACPPDRRITAWNRMAELLPYPIFDSISEEIPLTAVPEHCLDLLAGKVRGRLVVKI